MKTATTEATNTYLKFCPNVFVAKCKEQHEKGETIILTTRRGKENESIVFNFLGKTKDNCFLYSIIRADGFNIQERARRKADRYKEWSASAKRRSQEYYEASKEGKDFLSLGEPIKIGHHSQRRHENLIARNWARMGKSVEFSEKAVNHIQKAEYWEGKENEINLSMPESLEFFEYKLEEAKQKHKYLKDHPEARAHSYSLTYANKEVKELTKKVELSIKLWGSEEDIKQLNKEKEEEAKAKATKGKKGSKINDFIKNKGGFFFFGSNITEFKKRHANLIENGFLEEGEKVTHIQAGLYIPVKHKEEFFKLL